MSQRNGPKDVFPLIRVAAGAATTCRAAPAWRDRSTRHSAGFALPVVVLLSAVILLSVVTAAAVSSLGSRVSTANEKTAYQALLTAESGLNSFGARLNALNYPTDKPLSDLANKTSDPWVNDSSYPKRLELYSLSLGSNGTTTLSITATGTPNVISIRAESNVAGGNGKKIILQDYRRPEPAFIGAPAALTSFPAVDARGNSSISGSDYNTATGITTNAVQTSGATTVPTTGTFNLNVTSAGVVSAGQYVQIGTRKYRVTASNGNTLSLQATTTVTSPFTIASGSAVDRIRYATTDAISVGQTSSVVKVNNPRAFLVGDLVKVGTTKGKVTAIDTANNTMTVQWGTPTLDSSGRVIGFSQSTSSASSEGTPIVRNVSAIASAGTVTTGGSNTTTGTLEQNAANRVPSGDALFMQTFGGKTKSEIIPSAQTLSSTQLNTPGVMNGGLYYYEQSGGLNTNGFCGSGIIIVKADVQVTSKNNACPGGFTGVVYIIGNFDHRGNSLFTGAVVVEGNSRVEETNITGTGDNKTDQEKIRYDLEAVLNAGNAVPRVINPVAGTWRQQ